MTEQTAAKQATHRTTPLQGEKCKGLTLNPEFEAAIQAMEAQSAALVAYRAEREKYKATRCDLLRARKATEMAHQAERSNNRHAKRKYGVVDAPGTLADFFEDVESRLVSAWVDCCIIRSREVNQ